MERLNGNVQYMKIWHSCIIGEGGTYMYLLSMSDHSYEVKSAMHGVMNVMKILLHIFLIPSI